MQRILSSLVLATVALPATAQIGSVVRAQKLDELTGGLVGPLPTLGYSVTGIGDLDGDGVVDLVEGLPTDSANGPDHGGLLVMFLNANGTVARQQRINELVGGFTGSLPDEGYFGIAIAAVGDLDGDGRQELAVRSDAPRSTWILFLNADGTVRAHRQIPWSDPVFGGATLASDFRGFFVRGLAGMGDLDGDGVGDLAVGAPQDDDGDVDAGAVWILYMNADGSPKAAKKIAQGSSGFGGDLARGSEFGHSLARLGDVNGDGFVDLAVMEPGGGHRRWILFLDGAQDVVGASTQLQLTENLASLGDFDGDGVAELASEGLVVRFVGVNAGERKRLLLFPGQNGMPSGIGSLGAYGLAPLGDLDGDGTLELAAGNVYDPTSGGALWILSLARTPIRNGSGVNPLAYKELAEPALGATWQAVLDCAGHRSGVAVVSGSTRPLAGVFVPAGELLVDPASPRLFRFVVPHGGGAAAFSAAVPVDPALVGLVIHTQGLCGGAPGARLSNALAINVGR